MNVLILDTETSHTDPAKGSAIEVGAILFNMTHMAPVVSYAAIIQNKDGQPAETERINRIPSDLIKVGVSPEAAWERVSPMVCASMFVLAHNAEFDRGFVPEPLRSMRPWICTMDDIVWPLASDSKSLVAIALAHGLGVASAHRALTDCDLIARLLVRCHELGHDVRAMLARGTRPKGKFRAMVSYDTNALAKAAGFRWEPEPKMWTRTMAIEDAEKITAFRVVRLDKPTAAAKAAPLFDAAGAK